MSRVRELGDRLVLSEPAPKVVADNADLSTAADRYRRQEFAELGRKVSVREGLLAVSTDRS